MAHLLRKHHSEICGILDGSDVSLQSFTVSLYSGGIIDESTKHSVMRNKGITGADELMNTVTKVVNTDPSKYLEMVLDIMEKVKVLEIVSQSIRDKISTATTGKEEGMLSSEASPVVYKSVDELYIEAISLRDKFQDLLENLIESLDNVKNDRLKLRLNYHLTCERENTPEVKDILKEIGEISSPKEVLNCLIRSNLIGYFNHRLLDVFQGLIKNKEVDEMITKYEEAHEAFLKSSDLETLAQLFLDYPELAPETFAGLPRFTVHLDEEWEKKSTFKWNQLLKTKLNHWPAHIHIVMITKKCIIIEYCILPCDAPGIVRDLSDPQVLSNQGVTEIQLSNQLREMGKQEVNNQSPSLDSQQQSFPLDDSDLLQGDSLSDEKQIIISSNEDQLKEMGKHPSLDYKHQLSLDSQQLSLDEVELDIPDDSIEEKNIILLEAVQQGADTARVSTLIQEGANIHTTDENSYTPLHHAAEKGDIATVKLLLNEGATKDINTKQLWDETPLLLAAMNGHHSIIEILVQYGANVDEKNAHGHTPLYYAVRRGRKKTVELLLKYKAKYSIKSESGNTSMLHIAARSGNTEIVEIFLKLCGTSNLNEVGYCDCTPLHCAVDKGNIETVDLLIKSGANVDGGMECHLTPLHVAADKNHVDIAELLLRAGANVHSKDKNGNTPLHHAAQMGHEMIVKLLLKNGGNINEKDENGLTPMHLAVGAKGGHEFFFFSPESSPEDTLRTLLLANGAGVNEKDNYGRTPLYYAEKTQNQKIIQILLDYGAIFHSQIPQRQVNSSSSSSSYLVYDQIVQDTKPHNIFVSQCSITTNTDSGVGTISPHELDRESTLGSQLSLSADSALLLRPPQTPLPPSPLLHKNISTGKRSSSLKKERVASFLFDNPANTQTRLGVSRTLITQLQRSSKWQRNEQQSINRLSWPISHTNEDISHAHNYQ